MSPCSATLAEDVHGCRKNYLIVFTCKKILLSFFLRNGTNIALLNRDRSQTGNAHAPQSSKTSGVRARVYQPQPGGRTVLGVSGPI